MVGAGLHGDDGELVFVAHGENGVVPGAIAAVADVGVVVEAFDGKAEAAAGFPVGIHELDALHFAEGVGLEDFFLVGAEEAELPGGEFGEVLDSGSVTGGGGDAAGVEGLQEGAGAIALDGAKADSELFPIEIHWHRETCVVEAERFEDVLAGVIGVVLTGDSGDGFTDESQAEVAVLEDAFGG